MSQYTSNGPRRRPLTPEQRARIIRMRKKQRMKKRLMIAAPVAALAVVLVYVLVLTTGGKKDPVQTPVLSLPESAPQPAQAAAQPDAANPAVDANAANQPVDAGAGIQPADAQAGNVAPVPTEAPAAQSAMTGPFDYDEAYIAAAHGETTGPVLTADMSGIDPAKLDRWPAAKEGYIPLLSKAKTTENIIAVTVDDCFQGENLQRIVQCALDNNADLTIFPIGENLTKPLVASTIKWAWENGMEIENHTYSHAGMYHGDDEHMTEQMWYQSEKVSEVLGVQHQQHFFRPKGGDERNDQRVHAYAKQMGMKGIAVWTQSGSTDSMESLFSNLAPGNIYLFHTTDNDLKKLLEFIPGAVQRGYRLVTLNEMFGLPDNATSAYTGVREKPALEPFKVELTTLKKTSYIRAAAVVQERLIELGWLPAVDPDSKADGVYGQGSWLATGFFQMASDIKATGTADPDTQRALFADGAARGSKEQVQAFKKQLGA